VLEQAVDRIYTHFELDSHQDHEAVAKSTFGGARHCSQILQYGGPSAYGFNPSVFVDITESVGPKLSAIECHATQTASSDMVDAELIRANALSTGHLARLTLAEGFVPFRIAIEP